MELSPTLATMLALLVIIMAVLTMDDLFIDLCALVFKVKPTHLTLQDLNKIPEKKIAIMIANWHEDEVIEQMITGNNHAIQYSEHHFFLGVYPNDIKTLQAVHELEKKFSNVHAVINSKNGSTSKGQMLNEIVDAIYVHEQKAEFIFDLFVIHDSEDIIHPLSLKLMNLQAEAWDYIQIPIYSLNRETLDFTAGTYMDEFAEMHTKELLVRNALGAAIPSAGVGTCLNRRLLSYVQKMNGGTFLRPDSLTEDYILGWQSHLGGFRCRFACNTVQNAAGEKEIIATKEYFPGQFWQSVRQKTRWTIGIAFQGKRILRWAPNLRDNYFLLRDRRGPLNSLVTFASLVVFLGIALFSNLEFSSFEIWLVALTAFNFVGFVIRYVQRLRFYANVYGSCPAHLVLIRWPVAIIINALAALRAFYQFYLSELGIKKLKWSKTQHTLPKEFGQTA